MFYWYSIKATKEGGFYEVIGTDDSVKYHGLEQEKLYPAYTSGELGEMLPESISGREKVFMQKLRMHKLRGFYDIQYYFDIDNPAVIVSHENEAEARGLMLEYLIKNAFVKLEK